MGPNYTTDAIQTRSIEDSLSHAHDAAQRASNIVALMVDDLEGPTPEASANEGSYRPGVVSSADQLASRLEGLCFSLERVRSRIVSNAPKAIPVSRGYDQNKMMAAGRLG